MIAGHLITVVQGKRPKTYIVCEADPGRAVEMLREKLGAPLELPLSPHGGFACGDSRAWHR